MSKIKKHPQVIAWNKFTETDEYKRLVDGSTIRLPKTCEVYLANRINSAYNQGWKDAEKQKSK